MLDVKIIVVILCCFVTFSMSSQEIFGTWKTIDDKTGEAKSIVSIYKENGQVFGKIIEILDPNNKDALCAQCEGEEKNKPVLGLVLIKYLVKVGKYYKEGTILDPEKGKEFKCRLMLTDNPNVLQVRGYVSFMYATQFWTRVE